MILKSLLIRTCAFHFYGERLKCRKLEDETCINRRLYWIKWRKCKQSHNTIQIYSCFSAFCKNIQVRNRHVTNLLFSINSRIYGGIFACIVKWFDSLLTFFSKISMICVFGTFSLHFIDSYVWNPKRWNSWKFE